MRTWIWLVLSCVLCACPGSTPSGQWSCPADWVPTAAGGCGPAVLLCAPDGGAQPGACDSIDLSRPAPQGNADGGAGFYRLPDGRVGGAWSADDSIARVPPRDFAPSAGIPACAAGWTRLADGTCAPDAPTDCGAGATGTPGGACAPARASECAPGEWADVSAESGAATVVRVRAGASDASADGSAARPFGSLAAATTRAGNGGWVLLAAGSYASNATVAGALHLVGVCAARVVLTAVAATPALLVDGAAAALDLRGLEVRAEGGGVMVQAGARARLQSVRVTGALAFGVQATGAGSRLDAQRVLITGTRRPDGVMPISDGLRCNDGAQCTFSQSAALDSAAVGLAAVGTGSRLEVVDSVVAGTHALGVVPWGIAVVAVGPATATVRRSVLRDNAEYAAFAEGAGAAIALEDSIVRGDTQPTGPFGVLAQHGGSLTVARTLLADLHRAAVTCFDAGSRAVVSDSVIRGVIPWNNGETFATVATTGGHLELTRVLMESNIGFGIRAQDTGTEIVMADSVIRATRGGTDLRTGTGVTLSDGAAGTFARVSIEDNQNQGIFAYGAGTTLAVDDSVIRDTVHGSLEGSGEGLLVAHGCTATCRHCGLYDNESVGALAQVEARLTLLDSRLERSRNHGIAAVDATVRAERVLVASIDVAAVRSEGAGATLTMTDSLVLGADTAAPSYFGRGLEAYLDGRIEATRVVLEGTREFAAQAYVGASTLVLRDALVLSPGPSARGFGAGVVAFGEAHVTLERVAIDGASAAGVASLPVSNDGPLHNGGVVEGTDVFVRGTRSSTIQFDASPVTNQPVGRVVAYGLHVGTNNALAATRFTILGGGYGFYASFGTLALRDGVIARQLDAAGAVNGAPPSLLRVLTRENADDGVVETTALPEGTSLTPPDPVCGPHGCG